MMSTEDTEGIHASQPSFPTVTEEQQLHLKPWDTSDPFFTASDRDFWQRVFKCYVRQVIVFVGIPGNFLCCVVFFKQGLSDRINLLLFWLAVTDLANLLSQLMLVSGCYFTDKIDTDNWNLLANAKHSYVGWWLRYLSGIFIVIVSVDRCLSVVFPLKAKRLLGYRSAMIGIVLSYVLSLMVFLPLLLAFTVKWTTDPSTNRWVAYRVKTAWLPVDPSVTYQMIRFILAVTLPIFLSVMIVCCTITVLNLRQASRQRLKMTGNVTEESKAGQNRITVMLLVICAVYIVLALPETVLIIVAMVVPGLNLFQKYHNTIVVIYQFLWIGTCLNSAINFVVYFMLSSRFQKTLKNCFVDCVRAISTRRK